MSFIKLNAVQRKHRDVRAGVSDKLIGLLNRHEGMGLLKNSEQTQYGTARVSLYEAVNDPELTILPDNMQADSTVLVSGLVAFNYPGQPALAA